MGGTVAGARNVISGNTQAGVELTGAGTSHNLVEGNYIGTNYAGSGAIGNGSSSNSFSDGVLIDAAATYNTVGGTTAGARNVISGNLHNGVEIYGQGTDHNLVEGDYIGTNAAGTAALANHQDGVASITTLR